MVIKEGSIVFDGKKKEYEVLEFIDNGSFGSVYEIQCKKDKRIFALKTLPSSYVSQGTFDAFLNECKMSLKIRDKNVIEYYYIHDGVEFQSLPLYIIMEYANEGNLRSFIEQQKTKGFLSNDSLKSFILDLSSGMKAINSELVHRDIKPDNILIKDNILKISDFGLSKIVTESTRTNTFKGIGHIMYMAPEAWKYEKNTIQMDIYSMGLVFYELATFKHAYNINNIGNIEEWKDAHFFQIPQRPNIINNKLDKILVQVIDRMIEKETSKRYSNWDDIVRDISKSISTIPKEDLTYKILEKRLEVDNKLEKERLEKEKRNEEIKEFEKLVFYQFNEEIIKPINEFVEDFNSKYLKDKIQLVINSTSPSNKLTANLILISRKQIAIELRTLIYENFYREVSYNDFGEKITQQELIRPKLDGSIVLVWGGIVANSGKGFNLLLIEKKDSIYGSWIILKNKNMALSRYHRLPEPFPFTFEEIEKELPRVRTGMHIYTSDVEAFDVKHVIELIEEYN